MKTVTHIIINAALVEGKNLKPQNKAAFILGGALPDVPICILFLGVQVWQLIDHGNFDMTGGVREFSTLYFENPFVMGMHNFFHAPFWILSLTSMFFLLAKCRSDQNKKWLLMAGFFFLGCIVHSFIDIVTHYDDGPLLFWPFEQTVRYQSPLSHWNPRHYGYQIMALELFLSLTLSFWIAHKYCQKTCQNLMCWVEPLRVKWNEA